MALIRTGGGIQQISGSLGGVVFSHNRFGAYMRNRSIPVNPNSTAQQNVRADLAYLTAEWHRTLTQGQRLAWAVYAAAISFTNALGETIKLTGFNHFIRSNVAILNNDLDYVADGPTALLLPGTDPVLTVSLSGGAQTMSIIFDDTAAWCSEDDAYMSVHQGMPQAVTRNFFGGPFRRAGVILGNNAVPITSPQVVNMTFVAAELQKCWIQCRIGRADGRLSQSFRDDAIVDP